LTNSSRRLAVVGGGISGLAAAVAIARRAAGSERSVELVLLEQDSRLGGLVLTEDFAGARIDLGGESLLARDADTLDTLAALGLGQAILRPGTTAASLWNGKRLVPIPKGSALGVPPHPLQRDVRRAIGWWGALRACLEPLRPGAAPDPDGPLGPFISSRLGRAVLERLVDPLLGGVYAGPASGLSIEAVSPQLLQALARDRSLLRGLRQLQPQTPEGAGSSTSPFLSLRGGLVTLTAALEAALPPGSVRLGARVRGLLYGPDGRGQLRIGADAPLTVDGVVLALPAPPAADILSAVAPQMSSDLRRQEYSSVAIVTLAYSDSAFPHELIGSGFLVPRHPRRVVTACTYLDRKWPLLRHDGLTLLRVSAGSLGEEWVLGLDDTTLVSSVHKSLRTMLGVTELPRMVKVQRWQPALPQYRAGQVAWRENMQRQASALPVPVVLTGAAYCGVGLAACLREGGAAGGRLWDTVERIPRARSGPSPCA
jgi:oxygen-dependent protoporphyrinogen oxidase